MMRSCQIRICLIVVYIKGPSSPGNPAGSITVLIRWHLFLRRIVVAPFEETPESPHIQEHLWHRLSKLVVERICQPKLLLILVTMRTGKWEQLRVTGADLLAMSLQGFFRQDLGANR